MKYILIVLMLCSVNSQAVDAYDYESGTYVSIENQQITEGKPVEYYDYEAGSYTTSDVIEVRSFRFRTDVVVYDSTTDEYRTFEIK